MTLLGTNTFVILDSHQSSCVLVDPGEGGETRARELEFLCTQIGVAPRLVMVTHDHSDHIEAAAATCAQWRIPLLTARSGDLSEGICIGDGFDIDVIELKGHSADSVGLIVRGDHVLLSGDVVFLESWCCLGSCDSDLRAYFNTLNRVESLLAEGEICELLPGHGSMMRRDVALKRIGEYRRHRFSRLEQVREVIKECGSIDCASVARRIYPGMIDKRNTLLQRVVEVQMEYLEGQTVLPA
ncbi:MBL fold metallo-hydrolase [Berryella wangjianweii]|uniref:MBL fold metallo-hydrolase n=1 Tax=Berryella wangjianweii TaxID=2734634 RepID=A0A6M8J3X1_9ACTN|nr:MBL fold metallo-hydrolase [Berryella wangjianweii]QKF07841.1 MBL fold metallo-hydrolase [Berryella wangjianweii]